MLLLRFSISQMDVPTRQSYTMAVVLPDERSAAAGVTAIARSVGRHFTLADRHPLERAGLDQRPVFLQRRAENHLRLLLYRSFKSIKPPEENAPAPAVTK